MEVQHNWARVFQTKHGQVLIYREYDDGEEAHKINRIIQTPVAQMNAKAWYEEDKIDLAFEQQATQEKADAYAENAFSLAGSLAKEMPENGDKD